MKYSSTLRVGFAVLASLLAGSASAQISLYDKVLDPLAIADLTDIRPLRGVCFVGLKGLKQSDGSWLIASDEGKGVISHIWMTVDHGVSEDSSEVRIVIDDSTVVRTSLRGLGRLSAGALRPPFDTTMSGGTVCDVQMPYTRNFRVYYKGPYLFCAIMWRPLPDTIPLESFASSPFAYSKEQHLAELAYWDSSSPWKDRKSDSVHRTVVLEPGQQIELASLKGPAFIHTMEFLNQSAWSEYLDSLYLEVHWNNDPRPNIFVPLTDFFGQSAGNANVNAFQQRVSATRAISYMPMPFVRHASVKLVNTSSRKLSLDTRIYWSDLDTTGRQYGVLATAFRVSDPTKYGVDHELLRQQGAGRYIGSHIGVPRFDFGYFLEGDFQFTVDEDHGWRYTGTEDYINGAWYFEDSIFSLPFAGCTQFPSSMYRFHYMDAVDFRESLRLSCEHGHFNTVQANYRTTSFIYVEPQYFWAVRDTLAPDEPLQIEGVGFAPNSLASFYLDTKLIGSSMSAPDGSIKLSCDLDLSPGLYRLNDGSRTYNRSISITAGPAIYIDTSRHYGPFNFADRLSLVGSGFKPGEVIALSVDTFAISGSPVASDKGDFVFELAVPYTPTFDRPVVAVGNMQSRSSSPMYSWSRTLAFEAEDQYLTPPLEPSYMIWWGMEWSKSLMPFMYSAEPNSTLDISFEIPVSDTFFLDLYHNTCARYGNYEVYLDHAHLGAITGYSEHAYHDPQRIGPVTFGPAALSQGAHTLRFVGNGRDARAVENSLGVDNFLLRPSTAFLTATAPDTEHVAGQWSAYPSPSTGNIIQLAYTGESPASIPLEVRAVDMVGRSFKLETHPVSVNGRTVRLSLDVAELPAGTYFFQLPNGESVRFIKIAK